MIRGLLPLVLLLLLSACGPTPDSSADNLDKISSKPARRYVCPMHPNIVRDHPDHCPICGMDLVERHDRHSEQATEKPLQTISGEPAHHRYVCPMHPNIVRDHPDHCPICGMDLVERDEPETVRPDAHEMPEVRLSPRARRDIGLRVAEVRRGSLQRGIDAQGRLTWDEDRIIEIHPRTAGWIDTLYFRTDGVEVDRHDVLADFFSPFVLQAQAEFIDALEKAALAAFDPAEKRKADERVRLLRNNLRMLHVPEMAIMRIEKNRLPQNTLPIMPPQGGVITRLGVREGAYVEPDDVMFTIVDLSRLWVMIDFFEQQARWIRPGLPVEVRAPAIPGKVWKGRIEFVYPQVDPVARTLRARLSLDNPEGELMPDMFVEARVLRPPREGLLLVPREAVMPTGRRDIVICALGEGRFKPVEVETGEWGDDEVEILSGLRKGDRVVVSGQFLIDSESSLRAALRRLADEDD